MIAVETRSSNYLLGQIGTGLLALLIRLGFWWRTNWAIEDGMIIARMVRNLVEHGIFSFNLGERVSSSTAPLFGLISAAIAATGIPPLAAAKILGALASSATAVIIFRILYAISNSEEYRGNGEKFRILGAFSGSLIYILLPPVIAYSVSGLETAVYAFLCVLTLERLTHYDQPRARKAAIWLGSVTALFRPDGVIVLGVVLIVLLWTGRRDLLKTIAGFWPVLVVVPAGLLLHQLYFGVPVPQSLIAKAGAYQIDILRNARRYLNQMLFAQTGAVLFYILGVLGAAWCVKRAPRLLILLVWYAVYHALFIARAPLFDWYLQVPLFVLCLFAAVGLHAIAGVLSRWRLVKRLSPMMNPVFGFGLGAVLAVALVMYAGGKAEYHAYEESVRGEAGRWLSQNTPQEALVFTESLGYIGYYAHNDFVDWPGLASPGVPSLLLNKGVHADRVKAFAVIISEYAPVQLVLRYHEWEELPAVLKESYRVCHRFEPQNKPGVDGYLVASKECP